MEWVSMASLSVSWEVLSTHLSDLKVLVTIASSLINLTWSDQEELGLKSVSSLMTLEVMAEALA